MAGATMKELKLRIRSVENTRQITKAMQLVASSKLRGARSRMEDSKPYLQAAQAALSDIARHTLEGDSVYLTPREVHNRALIVIAGDRGLAGSYNANVFRLVEEIRRECPAKVFPIGRKAAEMYRRDPDAVHIEGEAEKVESLTPETCERWSKEVMWGFRAGEYDEVSVVCTTFVSVLTQRARVVRLLPIATGEKPESRQMILEPSLPALLEQFLPQYLSGVIYAAACDSVASEQAARRVAMDAATKNASEMIDHLTLRYNQARQSSITQELTEIVAGAEHG